MLCDILVNLISDFIFIAILVIIFWILWYGPALRKARKFFNVENGQEINIYISVHEDQETNTRNVVTVEEYEAASVLRDSINGQLKDSIFGKIAGFLSGLLGFDPKIPEINIVAHRFEEASISGTAFAIGGPVRNVFSKSIIEENDPWLIFNQDINKFQIAKGDRKDEILEPSGQLSIIEKIQLENVSVILAYGYGEVHTRAAVEYLGKNWKTLYKKYKADDFAICFEQMEDHSINIIREFRGK